MPSIVCSEDCGEEEYCIIIPPGNDDLPNDLPEEGLEQALEAIDNGNENAAEEEDESGDATLESLLEETVDKLPLGARLERSSWRVGDANKEYVRKLRAELATTCQICQILQEACNLRRRMERDSSQDEEQGQMSAFTPT